MAELTSTLEAVALPPSDAIAFLRGKTNTTSQRWTDVWNEAHTQSFMVAGAATKAIVGDFRDAVAKALEQGTTLAEFRKDFDAIVEKHGWVHNGTPGWRASIIYETNLSTAYSAGRYAQMTEPDTLRVYPYWQYMHTSSARPRPQHLAWVGTTLAASDPWWSTHYPPNGWRCKCSVRPVSEAGLRRQGKRGPDTAPAVDLRPWRSRDGRVVTEVPHGIDPGFGYNPGAAWKDGVPPPSTPRSPLQPISAAEPANKPLRRPSMPPAEAVDGPGATPPRVVSPAAPALIPTPSVEPPAHPGKLLDALREAETAVRVGPLAKSVRKVLATEAEQVLISPPQIAKQLKHHPELTNAEYAALPTMLASPAAVTRISPERFRMLLRGPEGQVLSAVVKTTLQRHELFVLSLHRVRPADLGRYMRREELLAGSVSLILEETDDELDGAPEGPPTNPP